MAPLANAVQAGQIGSQLPVLTSRAKFGTIGAVNATPLIRTRQMQLVEHAQGEPIEVLLERLYVREGLTQAQIAARLGVGLRSVIRWMAALGIPTRDRRALAPAESAA